MRKKLYELVPVVSLAALLLVVFWPVLTGSVYLHSGVIYSDMWLLNYPLKDWYRSVLLEGRFPFWISLLNDGYPIFAEGQIGALYPIHLVLFGIFPTLFAYNLNIYLHITMAGLFTYLICRKSFGLSKFSSFLAGLVYSLSGFFFSHLHQTNMVMVVSYFPLALLAVERIVTTGRLLWAFVLALTFALQIYAGYIEMHYYTVLLSLIFFIAIGWFLPQKLQKKKPRAMSVKRIASFGIGFMLAVGIGALQLLSTWELTQFSHRASGLSLESASSFVWPLEKLILFINPQAYDFYASEAGYNPLVSTSVNVQYLYGYVGLIPLFLAIAAIIFLRKRYVFLFSILLFGAFIYGFGKSTQLFTIFWEIIPGLKFFRYPVKILFFINFSLAILAGFGVGALWKFIDRKFSLRRAMIPLGMVVVALVFLDLWLFSVRYTQPTLPAKEWFVPLESVDFLHRELDPMNYRVYSHGTNNIDYQLIGDLNLQRDFQNLLPTDFNLLFGIPSNRETTYGLFLLRHKELNKFRTSLDPQKASLGLPAELKKVLALQSVRFLIADLPIDDPDLVLKKEIPFSREVDHLAYFGGAQGVQTVRVPARATYIYENKVVYPRAMFVSSSRVVADEKEALDMVLGEEFDPLEEVVLEEAVVGNEFSGTQASDVKVVSDKESEVEVSLTSDSAGYLVLSDTFYPGWKAEVDGEEAPIYRANYAFRAVPVEAGEHLVRFSFEPTYWRVGLWISGISLLITLLGLGYTVVRKK